MRFSQEFIEEVKNANDIIDVASLYINLKKKGRTYFGICPFHREKTPSFGINQDKQIYHCFGCNEGGTVIQLIQQVENMSFSEAVEFLANRANLALPKFEYTVNDPKEKLRQRCYLVNEEASKFFMANLSKEDSQIARDYILKRKLNKEMIMDFQIGFSGQGLYEHLKQKGFTDQEILEVGLVYKNQNGKIVNRYINRLMFTIKDQKGQVIGFSGRTLVNRDDIAKYINSNDNIVYNKGRNLFALNIAKKHANDYLIIVEGQMDAISLHQRGIKNVIAPLGTALTEAQARLIARFTKKVVFAYDSDNAGIKATIRGIEILKALGIEVSILVLKDAKDPDEYILKFGPELFKKELENTISVFEYMEQNIRKNYDLNKIDQKTKYLNEIVVELSKVKNTLEQEIYIDYISKNTNITKAALEIELKKQISNNSANNSSLNISNFENPKNTNVNYQDFEANVKKAKTLKKENNLNYENECHLIKKIFEDTKVINLLEEKVGYEIIKDDINKKILQLIFEINIREKNINNIDTSKTEIDILSSLENTLNEDNEINKSIKNRMYEIISMDIDTNNETFLKLIKYYEKLRLDEEILLISKTLNDSDLTNEDKLVLMQSMNELIKKKRDI